MPNAFLENSAEDAGFPQLAVGVNGGAIVAWTQGDGVGFDNLYVSSYSSPPNPSWGTPQLLENDPGIALNPELAMDAAGNAVAIWVHDDGTGTNTANVFANRYSADTASWSTPEQLDDGTGDDVGPPTLAINANGVAAAALQQLKVSGAIDVYGNQFD